MPISNGKRIEGVLSSWYASARGKIFSRAQDIFSACHGITLLQVNSIRNILAMQPRVCEDFCRSNVAWWLYYPIITAHFV